MTENFSSSAAFIWSIADLLRGDFKQSQYVPNILPFTLLRREQDFRLVTKREKSYLNTVKEGAGATPREKKIELLREIIERFNDLSAGEDLTDGDILSYANTIRSKVEENIDAMEQVNNNTKQQALLCAFPDPINKAVIDSMAIHRDMAMKVLASEDASKRFA